MSFMFVRVENHADCSLCVAPSLHLSPMSSLSNSLPLVLPIEILMTCFLLHWMTLIKRIVEDVVEKPAPFINLANNNTNSDLGTNASTRTPTTPFHGLASLGQIKMMEYG